jgi:hypothetical protein
LHQFTINESIDGALYYSVHPLYSARCFYQCLVVSARPLLLTGDDDFLTDFGTTEYTGLLFVDDDALGPVAISDIVHEIVTTVTDPSGHTYYVSRNWL